MTPELLTELRNLLSYTNTESSQVVSTSDASLAEWMRHHGAALLEALDTARETNRRLNYRCQAAEHAAADQLKMHEGKRGSLGRGMANWAATHYREQLAEVQSELASVRAELAAARIRLAYVAVHINQRPEIISAINDCAPGNFSDYWRWNGAAEARRQLAHGLGWTVPHNPGETTDQKATP